MIQLFLCTQTIKTKKSFQIYLLISLLTIAIYLNIKAQENDYNEFLKVTVSNTDPQINEAVTIKAECTAPFDLENASVLFHIYR
ncbi:MAG TPA: hypothetical protein VLM39_01240 [Ignavibacteriaceae bacterium]|nr:hypothetical protein [Ignavibacteriaceae bacterium]